MSSSRAPSTRAAPKSTARTANTTTPARSIRRFFSFVGVEAEAFKEQIAAGKGDGELLNWITENSTTKPKPWEIAAWVAYMEQRGPDDVETKQFFAGELAKLSTTREDISSWLDLLDLDDYVTFGGKA